MVTRLIQDDSPLSQIPINLQPDQRNWLAAVRFSVDILDISMQRLGTAVHELSLFSLTKGENETQAAATGTYSMAIADAWTAVDASRRLKRFLIDAPSPMNSARGAAGTVSAVPAAVPPGHNVEVSVRELAAALENVQSLRNKFQHLDEKINRPTGDDAETWGCLNWLLFDTADPQVMRSFVLIHHGAVQTGSKHFPLINPLGKKMYATVDHITLNAFGTSASLSAIYRSVATVVRQLEAVLRPQFEGQPVSRIVAVASLLMSPDPAEA